MFKLPNALEKIGVGQDVISELMRFKAGERKDDPARHQGLHGPYEEYYRQKHNGHLPPDYFSPGDDEPWGLRTAESRSNILWQILSGVMDRQPEFAAAYMGLALDNALADEDFAKELGKVHQDWTKYIENAGTLIDHQHKSMKGIYKAVSCPACSLLTAIAVRDPVLHKIVRDMLPLSAQDRKNLLHERGLAPLLSEMIPDLTIKDWASVRSAVSTYPSQP